MDRWETTQRYVGFPPRSSLYIASKKYGICLDASQKQGCTKADSIVYKVPDKCALIEVAADILNVDLLDSSEFGNS